MNEFRTILLVAVAAGVLAGAVLFGVQYAAIVPLIQRAETYEAAHEAQHSGHEEAEWKPADGWERTAFTALATVLTGIGQAAILLGAIFFFGWRINARNGVLWGLAAFACFHLAPALGLPPQPPGVPEAGLEGRQIWWLATVVLTAVGIYLVVAGRAWWLRVAGGVCFTLPHLVGAPVAMGESMVPAELVRQFVVVSLAASFVFWMTLGVASGFLCSRYAGRTFSRR
ncbi:MAG: CbtA family protein [Acidobacteriota bacterium]